MVSPPTLGRSEVIVTLGKCVREDRWEVAVFRIGWRKCCLVEIPVDEMALMAILLL